MSDQDTRDAFNRLTGQTAPPPMEPDRSKMIDFPLDLLSPLVRDFVSIGARSRGCPPEYIFLTVLAGLCAAIGDRAALRIKRGWVIRAIIWAFFVGKPGTAKSSAMRYGQQPLIALQRHLRKEFEAEEALYNDLPKEERARTPYPKMKSALSTDITIEATAARLEARNGLAIQADEILAHILSFDRYKGGKSGERQQWLSSWSPAHWKVDRRGTGSTYIEDPIVSICGGTQPDRLAELRGDRANDGFLDRFLPAWPISKPSRWIDDGDDDQVVEDLCNLFIQISKLPQPVEVTLSPDALSIFKEFVNEVGEICDQSPSGLETQWISKSPEHLGRLTLLLHVLSWNPQQDRVLPSEVGAETIEVARQFTDYFRCQFVAMIPAMGGRQVLDATDIDANRLLAFLHASSSSDEGWVKRSVIGKARHIYKDRLDRARDRLTERGAIEWQIARSVAPTDGRPEELWRLSIGRDYVEKVEDVDDSEPYSTYSTYSPAHDDSITEEVTFLDLGDSDVEVQP